MSQSRSERRVWRWGIVGTGQMANDFAADLARLDSAVITGVASHAMPRARAFAKTRGGRAYEGVAALLAAGEADVVYVATTHDRHCTDAAACLRAGVPVLVEKPFGLHEAQAEAVLGIARERGVFCMEAVWTHCLPIYATVRDWLAAGRIGEPRLVSARFGFRAVGAEARRLREPARGGGSLLDVGVYPLSLIHAVFGGEPESVAAVAHVAGGVDEQLAAVLRYPGGRLGVAVSAIETATDMTAAIEGTAGRILIPDFWHASRAELVAGGATRTVEAPLIGRGWAHEAVEVQRCLAAGETESPLVTHADTLAVLRLCDRIRREVGMPDATGD